MEDIKVGLSHSCAKYTYLDNTKYVKHSRVICWGGHDEFNQLRVNNNQEVSNEDVELISVGDEHTCITIWISFEINKAMWYNKGMSLNNSMYC